MGEGGPVLGLVGKISRMTELLRDRLTGEMQWALHQGLRELAPLRPPADPRAGGEETLGLDHLTDASNAVLSFAATVAGLAAENMVRGGGRMFLDLGRRVERAQAIVAELARALDQPGAAGQPARLEPGLRLALELRDSVITYRSRYLTVLQAGPVLDLVLADAGNPRGLAFQLEAARDMLVDLEDDPAAPLAPVAGRLLEEARSMVQEVRDGSAAPEPRRPAAHPAAPAAGDGGGGGGAVEPYRAALFRAAAGAAQPRPAAPGGRLRGTA